MPLCLGMTASISCRAATLSSTSFALEPKLVSPGEGAVGVENTVLVTREGYEILMPLEHQIFEV